MRNLAFPMLPPQPIRKMRAELAKANVHPLVLDSIAQIVIPEHFSPPEPPATKPNFLRRFWNWLKAQFQEVDE